MTMVVTARSCRSYPLSRYLPIQFGVLLQVVHQPRAAGIVVEKLTPFHLADPVRLSTKMGHLWTVPSREKNTNFG